MRKVIYSTSKVKHPDFFANMCNIVGTEELTSMEFSDYVEDTYSKDINDLTDDEYDKYYREYRTLVDEESNDPNEVEVSEDEATELALDINLDAEISMKSDGSWDFVDDDWAVCAETDDGSWYTSDDILVTTPDQLVQDVNTLLQLYLPIEQGQFRITGNIHLAYDLDEDTADFNISNSSVEDFSSSEEK